MTYDFQDGVRPGGIVSSMNDVESLGPRRSTV